MLFTVASRKAKRQLSASFTSDGRHIVSMGEDSTVYIWNYDKQSKLPNKCVKSVRSFEFFFSEGASIAVPWPGMCCTVMNDSDQISTQPRRILEPVTWQRTPDCFSLSSRLFPDSSSRASATWPEEKLTWQIKPQLVPGDSHEHYHFLTRNYCSLTPMEEGTWGSVIVTAGIDGAIKSFHNYGLPIRLWSKKLHSWNVNSWNNIVISTSNYFMLLTKSSPRQSKLLESDMIIVLIDNGFIGRLFF